MASLWLKNIGSFLVKKVIMVRGKIRKSYLFAQRGMMSQNECFIRRNRDGSCIHIQYYVLITRQKNVNLQSDIHYEKPQFGRNV